MGGDMHAAAPAGSSHADRTKLPETTERVDDHCSTCPIPSRRQTTNHRRGGVSALGKTTIFLLLLLSFLPHPPPPLSSPLLPPPSRGGLFLLQQSRIGCSCCAVFNLHFPSPGRLWESNPLPHPHCESILIEQRRRLNCLRLACDTNYPHVLSKIILIQKTIKSLVLAPASYSIASVL
jgi:hypothetical protein